MPKLKVNENCQAREKRKKDKAIADFNKPGNIQDKVDVIAEYLGFKENTED